MTIRRGGAWQRDRFGRGEHPASSCRPGRRRGRRTRGVLLHLAVEGVGEEAPLVLRVAFDAAVVAVADAVEARGVGDREGLEHDRVDEGEDGRRGADAKGEGKHGGKGEDGGQAHLAQGVGKVLAKGLHGVSLCGGYGRKGGTVPGM